MDPYSQETPDYDTPDLPPEDFSQVRGTEKTYSSDEFREPAPVKAPKSSKPIPITSVTKPVAELLKRKEAVPENSPPPVAPHARKRGRKPVSGKPLTASERKKRWREKHGQEALEKERNYLRGWRKKQKSQ